MKLPKEDNKNKVVLETSLRWVSIKKDWQTSELLHTQYIPMYIKNKTSGKIYFLGSK